MDLLGIYGKWYVIREGGMQKMYYVQCLVRVALLAVIGTVGAVFGAAKKEVAVFHDAIRSNDMQAIYASLHLVNTRGENRQTALHLAAQQNNEMLVNLLIQNQAHINAQTYDGRAPLHEAIQAQSCAVVQQLLRCGAHSTFNIPSKNMHPLLYAVHVGNKSLVGFLLDYGFDPFLRGCTLDGAKTTPIEYVIDSGNRDMLHFMVCHANVLNGPLQHKKEALFYAAKNNIAEAVVLMLRVWPIDVNTVFADMSGGEYTLL